MDYRALLKKYIEHVTEAEGVSFISQCNWYSGDIVFTEEEIEELRLLEKEPFDNNKVNDL